MTPAREPLSDHLAPPWRRQRALVRALRRRVRRGWLVRFGRIGAYYTAITTAVLALWMDQGRGVDGSSLLQQSMAWLSASAALVALGTAVDIAKLERADGLEALLHQRGYTEPARQFARWVATAELVTGTILWPALGVALVLVGLSSSFAEVVARSLRMLAVFIYAPLAGVLLAALARWSLALAPVRPRAMLLAMLVVPHAVYLATGEGPSAVRMLDAMLTEIADLAGGIG